MFGRLIVALLVIGAAAVVTMERETAEVADMTATLAESKYTDAEERARTYEKRAKEAEAKMAELDVKNRWLESAYDEAKVARELALLPLELRTKNPSVRGVLTLPAVMKVVRENAASTAACFARVPARGPELTMKWVVSTDGRVVSLIDGPVPEGYDAAAFCMRTELASWTFPKAPSRAAGLTLVELTWATSSPAEPR